MKEPRAEATQTVVAIISSNYLLRLGLQRITETEPWIKLIGQTAHGTKLDEVLASDHPTIAILDAENDQAIPDLIRNIKQAVPAIKIILLSGFDDVERTRQAFASGVDGIVLKVQPSSVLLATIAHLAKASQDEVPSLDKPEDYDNPNSSRTIPPLIDPDSTQFKRLDGLTEREHEVVRLVSEGLSNKDIADRLCISSITVRHHLTSIFDKLGVSNYSSVLTRTDSPARPHWHRTRRRPATIGSNLSAPQTSAQPLGRGSPRSGATGPA